jgi:putative spermidine/putrescine transport system permease protein
MHIDPLLERAASSLRADRFTTFRKIILPLSIPGMAAGFTLVFILAIAAYITPRLIGGGKVGMLGNFIYQNIMITLNWPLAATASIILIVLSTVFIVSMNVVIYRFFRHRL